MESVSTGEARKNLAELLNRAAYGGERFVITRHGKELVALVPVEEAGLLERLRAHLSAEDLRQALEEAGERGTVAWEDVKSDLDL